MTPQDLYLLVSLFIFFLTAITAVLENTERGRACTERAIRWMLRP